MHVYGAEFVSSSERRVLVHRDMLSLVVHIALGEPKIDEVDIQSLRMNHKIIRLEVSVDDLLLVDVLKNRYQLVSDERGILGINTLRNNSPALI